VRSLVLALALLVVLATRARAAEPAFPGHLDLADLPPVPLAARVFQDTNPPDAIIPPEVVRQALYQFGWTEPAATWVASQVPFWVRNNLPRGAGAFYPGYEPVVGRVELAPDPKAFTIEHEAHHAYDYAYGKTVFGLSQIDVVAEFAALSTRTDDVGTIARDVRAVHSDDWPHYYHYMADWLGRDYALLPEPVHSTRFGYALGGVAPRYRAFLPVTPGKPR
jgi:hypothetical protein